MNDQDLPEDRLARLGLDGFPLPGRDIELGDRFPVRQHAVNLIVGRQKANRGGPPFEDLTDH